VIDIQQRTLGAFKQNGFLFIQRLVQQFGRIANVRPELFAVVQAFLIDFIAGNRRRIVQCRKQFVFVSNNMLKLLFQYRHIQQIAHPHGKAPSSLVGIAGSDSAGRRADFSGAEGFFPQTVFQFMIIQHHVGTGTDPQPAFQAQSFRLQPRDFFQQYRRIHHDAVGNYAGRVGPHSTRWHQVQGEFGFADDDGMARIGPAAVTYHNIRFLGKNINHLTLAFVSPLKSYYTEIHCLSSLSLSIMT